MPSSPPHVLHYLKAVDLAEGGVVRAVIDLCNIVSQHDCEITIATYNDKDVPTEWQERPNAPRVIHIANQASEFQQALETATVAHLHTVWDPKNLPIARKLRRLGVPYIISAHGMLDDWCMAQKSLKKRVFHWLFVKRLLENACRVHCTAEGEEQQACKWYSRGRSVVLPLVVDMPSPNELPGPDLARETFPWLTNSAVQLLFLSRIHPKKGIEHLLQAAARVVEQGVAVELSIAGPGESDYVESLRKMAATFGIAEQTHFVGLVQGDAKLSLYQAADLFVLPTYQENFGLVLPESLVCGTPVVTTKGVDIWPEIEAAGGTIIGNDPDRLAESLLSLLADRKALPNLGARGRDHILQWLDPARVAQQFQQLYLQAAAGPLSKNRA